LPSPDAGGAAGDVFVIVQSKPDTRFERDEANLWHREEISVADAVLGTSLDVPTFNGYLNTKIPPGTQPNSVLRLRSKGLRNSEESDEEISTYVWMFTFQRSLE
jgi:molecular chaperone DnaJ